MTRNVILLVVAAVIALLTFTAASKYLDGRTIQDLRWREAVQQTAAIRSNVRQAALMAQLASDSVAFAADTAALHKQLRTRQTQTVRIVQVRDAARATIDPDTLSAGLRNLLMLERNVAESFRSERDLERQLRESAERQIATLLERQRALRILLLDVTAQRDSALALSSDAIALVSPSFFRDLFKDIPRKLACAGGGAIVAEFNNGKALTGAAIALGVCLAAEAIF